VLFSLFFCLVCESALVETRVSVMSKLKHFVDEYRVWVLLLVSFTLGTLSADGLGRWLEAERRLESPASSSFEPTAVSQGDVAPTPQAN